MVLNVDLSPILLIIGMQLVVLVLGCFMDQVAIMLITLPIFLPVILALGYDPIWFAVLLLINLETALMTPSLGLLLVIMKGLAPPDTTFRQIYAAAAPFILRNILVMAVLLAFPDLLPGFVSAVQLR